MKKALCLIIALLVLIAVPKANAETPAVGDKLHGFTVSEVSAIEALDADVVKLTHDRTGAQVIFVLNDDQNRGFSICFHTEPSDDTGKLHILEHAICAASEKYPGQDVFFDSIASAYITDINAWTSLSSTNYYVTSLDEDQLEVMADFYLDCAFHSALLTEPNYFYREGWRYELPSMEDDLTINGIVYNEMKGAYGDITSASFANINRALFPDTYQSRDSGGNPQFIPDLSYEELEAFCRECYSPANSVSMFYGDVDMNRFLAFLNDNYFSVVDPGVKAEISPGQQAFEEPVHAVCSFPVAEGTEDAGAFLSYSTVLTEEESTDYTYYALCEVVAEYLEDNSSPLMQALNASGIGSSYSVRFGNHGSQFMLIFTAYPADASRDQEFRQIILDSLTQMAEEGFDQELLQTLFDSQKLSLRLKRESSNVAVDLFENLTWIQEMGNDAPLNPSPWYEKAADLCAQGGAEQKFLDWVVNNPHAALVTTVPEPGLLEKNEQALAQRLAEKKASMTEEEKQALVEETAAFYEWVQQETPAETLEKISVVDPNTMHIDLDASLPLYDISTREQDGVTVMSIPSDMDMSYLRLFFDIGHLSDQEIARLRMYSFVLGGATLEHTQGQITAATAGLIRDLKFNILAFEPADGECRPLFTVEWKAPNERLQESVDLVFELLRKTDLTANADLLAQSIAESIEMYRNPEKAFSCLSYSALASQSSFYAQTDKMIGLALLDELNAALELFTQDKDAFIGSFEAIQAKAFQRDGANILIAGGAEGQAESAILAQLQALPERCGDPLALQDTPEASSIAYVCSTQASYLLRAAMLENRLQEYTGDKLVVNTLLRSEYLLPQLRFQLGAYNTSISLNQIGRWSVQYYRGGSVLEADRIIQNAPAYLRELEITQQQLDTYKLPVISSLLLSSGELTDAMNALSNMMSGVTPESKRVLLQQVLDVTIDDIPAVADALQDAMDRSTVTILTSAAELSGHEEEFDRVIQLP